MATRTLQLENGLTFTKPDRTVVESPINDDIPAQDTDTVSVDYLGAKWSITYAQFSALFTGTSNKYSALTAFGDPLNDPLVSGPHLSMQDLINYIWAQNQPAAGAAPSFSDFCTSAPSGSYPLVQMVAADDFTTSILGEQIMDGGGRHSYEDIDSMTNVNIDCGFVKVEVPQENGGPKTLIRFGIGQQSRWEVNGPLIISVVAKTDKDGNITGAGETIIKLIDEPGDVPKWEPTTTPSAWYAYIGPVGGEVGIDIDRFASDVGTPNPAPAGSILRFCLEEVSGKKGVLNEARLYYTYTSTTDGSTPAEPPDPLPTIDSAAYDDMVNGDHTINNVIYNVMPPRYAGVDQAAVVGDDYPVYITLDAPSETQYWFKAMFYAPDKRSSDIMNFKFSID